MAGDVVTDMLQLVRQLIPNAPEHVLQQIEATARARHGARAGYTARSVKSSHLERLESAIEADASLTNQQLADMLGLSIRQVQRYKPLIR